MDLGKFLKASLKNMHVVKFNNAENVSKNRAKDLKEKRKNARFDLIMKKRKMEEESETKVNTEALERLERLKKYKEEKQKRLKEEQKLSKPVFKVYHANGLPSIEEAMKTIKGKSLQSLIPKNHKFTAPKNIKPIEMSLFDKSSNSNNKNVTNLHFKINKSQDSCKLQNAKKNDLKKTLNSNKNVNSTRNQSNNNLQKINLRSNVSKSKNNEITNLNLNRVMTRSRVKKLDQGEEKKKDLNTVKETKIINRNKNKITKNNNCKDLQELSIVQDIENINITDETEPVEVIKSPFIIKSRGKENARKEYLKSVSEQQNLKNASYFRNLLDGEIERIQKLCETWKQYMENNVLNEEAIDMINMAIGQSQLLTKKKCQQFRSLIEQSEKKNLEKPILLDDLQGFWDMILLQVQNIYCRFENLERIRSNDWNEIRPKSLTPKKIVPKVKKINVKGNSKLKDAIKNARQKMNSKEESVTEHGFFVINTPKKRLTMRKSLKDISANTKFETPGRSILKPENSMSTRKSKCVTFIENNFSISPIYNCGKENLTSSGEKLRRSKRLSFTQ